MDHKDVSVTLFSKSPYSPSAPLRSTRGPNESADEFDQRCWREHMHTTGDNKNVVIPCMAFKKALEDAASYKGEKVQGKGGARYGKHFGAGVMMSGDVVLPIRPETVEHKMFYCHADGKRTCGTRVWRRFPDIPSWEGEIVFTIIDPIITKAVFEKTLEAAGLFIGVGRFRPQNKGFYGRFGFKDLVWPA